MLTRSISTAVAAACLAATVSADLLVYTGDHTPDANVIQAPNTDTYGNLFSTTVFGGTNWSSTDGVLTLNTAFARGIWFGTTRPGSGYPDISGFQLSDNTAGNSIQLNAAFSESATSWDTYFYDQDGYWGGMSFNFVSANGSVSRPGVWVFTPEGTTRVTDPSFDTEAFHTYEVHIQGGQVVYKVDGQTVYQGASLFEANPANTLLGLAVIGDGSGTTQTGTGSMYIDHLTINNAAGPVPEPASALLAGLGMALVAGRRRRACV